MASRAPLSWAKVTKPKFFFVPEDTLKGM